jgi:DNA polymerase III epsilon subunit-like protein
VVNVKTIYFDLETGGVKDEPVIQIAAIAVEGLCGSELDCFEQNVQFDESLCDPEALKVNHYRAVDWSDAISLQDVVRKFAEWARPYCSIEMVSKRTGSTYMVGRLAGYNALTFDMPRLKAMFGERFFPFSYHVRDALQLAMWHFDAHEELPKPKSLKLVEVCEFLGVPVVDAHDAFGDVRMTIQLVRKLQCEK